ncbi:MAG: DNA-processing protein DprA, partial [Planctomycetota bacterium]
MRSEQHSPQIELWLKLVRAEGIGPTLFKRLLDYFGGVERILTASVVQLTKVEGIGNKTAERIVRTRDLFDADSELALADKLGVWIMHLQDDRYPPALRAIYDPPPVLYIKGTLTRSDNLAMAIVGSRRCSHYGTEQANRFSHLLASAGFTIVSGLARGIDSAAHRGALATKGRTIAVQGCGLSNIFPPENKKLFEQITENGAVISELPLTYEPLAENFPG